MDLYFQRSENQYSFRASTMSIKWQIMMQLQVQYCMLTLKKQTPHKCQMKNWLNWKQTIFTNPLSSWYITSFIILSSQAQSEGKEIQYCNMLLCNKVKILTSLHFNCALQVENVIARKLTSMSFTWHPIQNTHTLPWRDAPEADGAV